MFDSVVLRKSIRTKETMPKKKNSSKSNSKNSTKTSYERASEDALKEFRRLSREEEIKTFGHSVSYSKVFRNRKKYYRKKKHTVQYSDD